MAHIQQQTITVTISKLVRNQDELSQIVNSDQLTALLDTLPSVVEQILDDSTVVVEAQSDGPGVLINNPKFVSFGYQ